MSIFGKLINRNREKEPMASDFAYGILVENRLKKYGYSPSKIQAILNNYLSEPENPKCRAEFELLQEYRRRSKKEIKEEEGL